MKSPLFVSCMCIAVAAGCGTGTRSAEPPVAATATPSAAPAAPASNTAASTAVAASPTPSAATAPPAQPDPSRYRAIVDAQDRDAADRQLDAGRHPAELLAFIGVEPGMRVAELGAGGGYTSELLARAVGPTGVVYGQNTPAILQRFAEKPWSRRLQKPVMKNVVREDREFADPFPSDVRDLDAVVIVLFYHDTVWQGVDRHRMNKAVFAALRPGGVYVIVDHSSRRGAGTTETKTLHRIEESVVKNEVLEAGFKLAAEADFLRNPSDARDWNASPMAAGKRRGTSDRFALKFVKP